MADAVTVDAKAVFYAPVSTAVPATPTTISAFTSGGWTQVEDVTEDGVEMEMVAEGPRKRPMGARMPTSKKTTTRGMKTLKFSSYRSDNATLALSIPDAQFSGTTLVSGDTEQFVAMAVLTNNNVWHAKKVSAVGNLAMKYNHENFATPPFEFECFERDTDALGTSNYEIIPLP